MELLEARNARVDYHDPHIPEIPHMRHHPQLGGRRSIDLTENALQAYDAVLIATDHDAVDYAAIVAAAPLVVDTRNACARAGVDLTRVVQA